MSVGLIHGGNMALNPADYAVSDGASLTGSAAQSGGLLVQGGRHRRGRSRRGKSRRGKSRRGLRGGDGCTMPAAVGGMVVSPPAGGGRSRRLRKLTHRVRHHRTKSYSAGDKRKTHRRHNRK